MPKQPKPNSYYIAGSTPSLYRYFRKFLSNDNIHRSNLSISCKIGSPPSNHYAVRPYEGKRDRILSYLKLQTRSLSPSSSGSQQVVPPNPSATGRNDLWTTVYPSTWAPIIARGRKGLLRTLAEGVNGKKVGSSRVSRGPLIFMRGFEIVSFLLRIW